MDICMKRTDDIHTALAKLKNSRTSSDENCLLALAQQINNGENSLDKDEKRKGISSMRKLKERDGNGMDR